MGVKIPPEEPSAQLGDPKPTEFRDPKSNILVSYQVSALLLNYKLMSCFFSSTKTPRGKVRLEQRLD